MDDSADSRLGKRQEAPAFEQFLVSYHCWPGCSRDRRHEKRQAQEKGSEHEPNGHQEYADRDGEDGDRDQRHYPALRDSWVIDPGDEPQYPWAMNAVEFTTELKGSNTLEVPSEAAARLPKAGRARVIVLTDDHDDEAEWRLAAYEQFLREDASEDSIYDPPR